MSPAKRKLLVTVAVLGSATLFQTTPGGCARYGAVMGLYSIDFCSIVNCEGGTFFSFCEPVPLLVDCPNYAEYVSNP
jgi:hypothetical protein